MLLCFFFVPFVQLHYLLTEESAALLDQLTPPEVGTVIRGMALSGYNPGDHFIHNALVALQPSIPELPLGDTMQVLFALGRFPYAPQLGLPAAVPRHHKQEAHAATPLPPLPAPDSGKMALGDEVQKELDGFLGELDGGSGSSGGGLGSDEGDADVGQYHRIEFRGLREMQLMAELSGSSRRYLLGGDASVDANVGGDGSLRTGMRYTYEVQAQPQYDFSSLVGAASRRREERGEAARLAREAEAILRIFRGRVAAAASNSPSPSATATRGSSTGGRTLKERSKSSTKEVDVDGLVHKLLTGDWLSADAESGSEGRKQQRILRLDRLLAEAKVNPKSGRTTIMPHYDASLLWGGSEYEKALFSVPEVTFPLDLDALRGEVDDAEDDAAPSGAPTELDPWMAPGIAAPVAPSELPEGVPPDAAEVAAAVIGALARRALELIPDRSSDITLRLPRHMAVLRHWDAGLLRDIAAQARKENITSTTRPNVLVEFLWAYAVLGEPLPPSLTRDVTSYLLTLRCELGQRLPVDFARLAWSLAALDALDADTFRAICQVVQPAVITTPNGVKLPNKSVEASRTFLIQLYQAALHLQASKGVDGTALLPPAIRGPAAAAWKRRANALRTSATQRHVADVLRMLGVKCELEYEPPGSNVIIDIAVTSPQGERLAVEVDGPSHFASNVHDKFLGSIRLRNNLLKHSG